MYRWLIALMIHGLLLFEIAQGQDLAITMDDPNTYGTPLMSPTARDEAIRQALSNAGVQAALFACGMRVDSAAGSQLLAGWARDGHIIANHTYSHKNFNAASTDLDQFRADIEHAERLLTRYATFRKLFRHPFLKEGDTESKRDGLRRFLKSRDYRIGYVTIDASDWYVSERLARRLSQNPSADIEAYRDFYLDHLWERAQYYDALAKKVVGRSPRHTLLIHHNLLNALFLDDVIAMFRSKGWRVINAADAYEAEIYRALPKTLPAGESLIWAMAKETGRFDDELRYPGEDSRYEKPKMDKLGL